MLRGYLNSIGCYGYLYTGVIWMVLGQKSVNSYHTAKMVFIKAMINADHAVHCVLW